MLALNRARDKRIVALSKANNELPLARDQALAALEVRTAFVASMSHAIRTPLSAILGVSEALLDKNLDRESTETVQTVLDCAVALRTIVNDILDISSQDNDSVQVRERAFNPSTLINDCLRLVQPDAANKQLKLKTMIDPTLPVQMLGDQSKIRQVLLNLIGNAVKFTAAGTVTVEAVLLSQSKDSTTLKFSVTDTGIGIATEDAPLLFTPFSRIEKSTKGIKGSGLGLAISKRLVDQMHGTIDFESKVDGGSRFWLVLSLKNSEPQPGQNTAALLAEQMSNENELLSGCRVLLVEDSRSISLLTLRQLAKLGIRADLAANGFEAIEKIQEGKFDIVLMDINLPDFSGCEVTAKIRQMEAEGKMATHVIIAVTAGGTAADQQEAMAVGMDDFLVKPVPTAKLKETIIRWLEARPA
jgi:CheY-like chemotaxis protein